jgi:hypothetical protein
MTELERTSAGLQTVIPGSERRTLPKSTTRDDENGQGLLHFYKPTSLREQLAKRDHIRTERCRRGNSRKVALRDYAIIKWPVDAGGSARLDSGHCERNRSTGLVSGRRMPAGDPFDPGCNLGIIKWIPNNVVNFERKETRRQPMLAILRTAWSKPRAASIVRKVKRPP